MRCASVIAFLLTSACTAHRPVPSTPATLDPVSQLRHAIEAATHLRGVEQGIWGIVVDSLDRGNRLFELNPRTLLVPASAAKLVSVASAVDAVGWNYQFQTSLGVNGVVVDVEAGERSELGILKGDLLIRGSGDPSIGGRGGEDLSAWVEAIKARGIRRIDGRVIGDDDALEEPRPALAWAWDDLGYTTGALFGALNYAENRTTVTVAPASMAGQPALLTGEPFTVGRPVINRVITGAAGSIQQLWPEQRPGEPGVSIAGSIPAGARPASLAIAVGNPTLWFASVLRARLIAAGIPVTGPAADIDELDAPLDTSEFVVIHVHRSKPLAEIVKPLLKESINLYAEAVMRLNTPPDAFPSNDAALLGLRQRLSSWGLAAAGQQLVDGSGLSRRDVMNTDTLVAVLRRMHDASGSSPWMTALPVAGVDGSLETRMRGTAAENNLRAKTGTMSNVRSLAGYVTTRDGERLAFATIVNNFEGTGADANQAIDAIAVRLAMFSRK
ncbi:MAG TPA: D-alanyl-D-alanine carboxypeptidase/D-alanyl-D-alanine-endopeptidase [Vicinamibacterales bacterium]|nr:D-alanyl-D-alanine carboxypeptidase/D-alanyl-D-alanine-endopeptidase [Vicinamibacterales bacterium]